MEKVFTSEREKTKLTTYNNIENDMESVEQSYDYNKKAARQSGEDQQGVQQERVDEESIERRPRE